jgi:hypothetical protein
MSELGNKTVHNQIFAAWLVDIFGQKALRGGRGVVDIAGGLGLISFELSIRYGVPCTLVEPREVKLKGLTRRYGKKVHRNRTRALTDEGYKAAAAVAAAEGERSLMRFIQSLFPTFKDDLVIDEKGVEKLNDEKTPPFHHIRSLYTWPLHDNGKEEEILSALKEASVIVGMHSDGATENILDAALALNKPFAIIPCCVFPKENPHRLFKENNDGTITYYETEAGEEDLGEFDLNEGQREEKKKGKVVTTTEEFIGFLKAKDASIHSAILPFMGQEYRLVSTVILNNLRMT